MGEGTAGTVARRAVEVRAAGGVIIRASKKGPKVLLVHRPRYGDWSLPKGKLEHGEKHKDAALREVLEETGFRCKLHKPSFPSITYTDRDGCVKEVRYWLMTVLSGTFEPNHEVDLIAWVRLDNVADRLSYPVDQAFILDVAKSGRIKQALR